MAQVPREPVADVGHGADPARSAQESPSRDARGWDRPVGAAGHGGVVRPGRQGGIEEHRHSRGGIPEGARDEDRIARLRSRAQSHFAALSLSEHEDVDEDSLPRAA